MFATEKKFLFVVGKGGVGKTTVSAALALNAALSGKRVLVAQCNAKDRMGQALSVDPIDSQVRTVLPNLDAVNMEPGAALEEYGMMVLRVRALYKMIFENRLVAAFLRGTPGLEAWAMLGKAQFHAREEVDGEARYDLVIVDAPATGHGLDLLRVPKVLVEVAPPGLLRKEAEHAWELFSDPQRAGVVLVALAEDMPTNETLELHAAIRDDLQLPIAGLVVNRVLESIFSDSDGEQLRHLQNALAPDSALWPLVHNGLVRHNLEHLQQSCIARLSANINAPLSLLPRLEESPLRRPQLQQLAQALSPLTGPQAP